MLNLSKTYTTRGCLVYHNKYDILLKYHHTNIKKLEDNDVKVENATKIEDVEFLEILDVEALTTFKSSNGLFEVYDCTPLENNIAVLLITQNSNIKHIVFYSPDLIGFIVSSENLNIINRFVNSLYDNSNHYIPINYKEQCEIFSQLVYLVNELGIEKISYSPFEYDMCRDRYTKIMNSESNESLNLILDMEKIVSGNYNVFYEPYGRRTLFYPTNKGLYIISIEDLEYLIKENKYTLSDYGKVQKLSRFETINSFCLISGYIQKDKTIILDDCYYFDKSDISEYEYKYRMNYVSRFIDNYYVVLQEHDYDAIEEKIIIDSLDKNDTTSYVTEKYSNSKFLDLIAITSKHIESMAVFRSTAIKYGLFEPYAHDYDVGGIVFKPHQFNMPTLRTKYTSELLKYMNFKFNSYTELPLYFVDMMLLKIDRIIYEILNTTNSRTIVISTCSKKYNKNPTDAFINHLFEKCIQKLQTYNHYKFIDTFELYIDDLLSNSSNVHYILFEDCKIDNNTNEYRIGWDPLIVRGFFNSPFRTTTFDNFVSKVSDISKDKSIPILQFNYNSNSNICNFEFSDKYRSVIECNFRNSKDYLNSKLIDTLRDYMSEEFLILFKFIN